MSTGRNVRAMARPVRMCSALLGCLAAIGLGAMVRLPLLPPLGPVQPTEAFAAGAFSTSLTSQAPAAGTTGALGVVAWGQNDSGQLGDGLESDSPVPVAVSGASGVAAVTAGGYHGFALSEKGTVMAWGDNGVGQLGVGTTSGPEECSNQFPCSKSAIPVKGLSAVTALAGGALHSLALLANGTVMAWGANYEGQLGDGTTSESDTPVPVPGLTGIKAIAAGGEHSLALVGNGTVMAWGENRNGELGDGSTTTREVPVEVSGLQEVSAIAAGYGFSLALLKDGTVMSWGRGIEGQLGNGGTSESTVPVEVSGLSGVTAIAAGGDHALALLGNGTVVAWGRGGFGQLGDGSTAQSDVPVDVCALGEAAPCAQPLSSVSMIAAGGEHSLALLGNGTVDAWGENLNGELGNASTKSSDVPVRVSGLSEATAIAAGTYFSLAAAGAPPVPFPRVEKVEPNEGSPAGGTSVTIAGANFGGAESIHFGNAAATSFEVVSETEIRAIAPAGTGTVDIVVTTANGESAAVTADRFLYTSQPVISRVEPNHGPPSGGTRVTIKGLRLAGATAVRFGSVAASSFTVESETAIAAVSPPFLGGGQDAVGIYVTTPAGTTEYNGCGALERGFIYEPTITKIAPVAGLTAGGTAVTITGAAFMGSVFEEVPLCTLGAPVVQYVRFGSSEAQHVNIVSPTQMTAVSPPGTGTVNVTIKSLVGSSPLVAADEFTYVSPSETPTVTAVEPAAGPVTGGAAVTVRGTHLKGASTVRFGSTPAAIFTVTGESTINAIAPAGSGTVDVTVTTPAGTSAANPSDRFTYRLVEQAEYRNWTVSGTLTDKRLGQAISLPEGAAFTGAAQVNVESGLGSVTGNIFVPPFSTTLKLFGVVPLGLGTTLTQVGGIEGSLARSETVTGDEVLTLPVRLDLGVTSVSLVGLKIPTKCATVSAVQLELDETLTREEALAKGWSFAGTTAIPPIRCEGGLLGQLFGSVLSSLVSGVEDPYAISVRPPSG